MTHQSRVELLCSYVLRRITRRSPHIAIGMLISVSESALGKSFRGRVYTDAGNNAAVEHV